MSDGRVQATCPGALDHPTVDDEDAGTIHDTPYTYGLTSPSWTDPTGSWTTTLDKFDRPTAMTDRVSASRWTFSYGTGGQVLSATQGNGNTVTSTFDTTGRESTRTTTDGGTTRAAYTWTHNRAGVVLSEASTIAGDPANGTIGYGYDPLGRLTASGSTGYTWDRHHGTNAHKETTWLADASGAVLSTLRCDPWCAPPRGRGWRPVRRVRPETPKPSRPLAPLLYQDGPTATRPSGRRLRGPM